MKKTIHISREIGVDLRTRSFFRRDLERIIPSNQMEIELDFTDVVFISRSVADELYTLLHECPTMRIKGMAHDVEMMYNVVKNGRKRPRVYPENNTRVVHLNTMKEMECFFASL